MKNKFNADVELIESHSGAYEINVDDVLIYSKKTTGEFPDEKQLLRGLATD